MKTILVISSLLLCSYAESENFIPPQAINLSEYKDNKDEVTSTFKINERNDKAQVISWLKKKYTDNNYIECKQISGYENVQVWLPSNCNPPIFRSDFK